MSVKNKCGWPQFDYGDTMGIDGRYTIRCKLGWGMHSSTWLAFDSLTSSFVAIKALTGYMTEADKNDETWEQDALRLLNYSPRSPHCLYSLDEFTIPGKGSAGGHLCMVTPLMGGDVRALCGQKPEPIALPIVKRILLHTLRGLAFAHFRGVVHTDIKANNIFFSNNMSTEDIEHWLAANPPRFHDPEPADDGLVQSAISQPLPMISPEAARSAVYTLGDWGSGLPSELHPMRTVSPPLYRAPEVYLGAEWDTPVDIWSFGCLVYELTTCGRPLFQCKPDERQGLTKDENMLYQMSLFTNTVQFPPALLNRSRFGTQFIGPDCLLLKKPQLYNMSVKDVIVLRKVLPEGPEANAMAAFILRCLRIIPEERATADELIMDPWLTGID
ncbi:kinase-like protein [Gymnopus androsaceus JB14]|uniref:non-specific serine/threonine protein kinase n=1 Tax=Gymnopus androsaceus JB14 TaxID=1447944 RepID=A0A6A4HFI4_9AGAR|nr:kinase-like protein [Gymnopus androsaceus JB14]